MSARKGINLKRVKNQLELLEGILEQDATSRCKNISSRCALRIAQACVDKQIAKPLESWGAYQCCPSCGVAYIFFDNYCPVCGQKIDWQEVENNGKTDD